MPSPHRARKRFGQHFLTDQGVIEDIARAIAPQSGDLLVEIGPGLQALTQPLLQHLPRDEVMAVVELDRDLAERLRGNPRLLVTEKDALKVNFLEVLAGLQHATKSQQDKLRVVGNLPYNISSPLLFHLMGFASQVQDQVFMLQKEVVDRMVAAPSTKAYGRLSVMLQWRYEMQSVLDVPPEAFDPPPKVMSAVVAMQPKPELALPNIKPDVFADLVRVAFSQRRKLLRHSLGRWLEQRDYAGSFDLKRRAEEVSVEAYLRLAEEL